MKTAHSVFLGLEQRLGRAGLAAMILLTGIGAFYLLAVLPLQAQVASSQADAERLQADAQQARRGQTRLPDEAAQLQTFYSLIPGAGEAPVLLNEIFGTATRAGVQLDTSHYQVTEDKGGRLMRYEITLPVNGPYLEVRTFVAFVMAYVPSLSLDSLVIRKDKIDDAEVKADIKMTLYLERA